jgi:trans-aconitate methyltransferase
MTAQMWYPERYIRNAGFVAQLGLPVVELLDPQPGEQVLDLGCGDGWLTEKLVEAGCQVVGVDSSAEQITAAQARRLEAYVMDGRQLTFNEAFDAVFSNAALHLMKQPEPVIRGVWRALKPGGRFVGEFGGHGNVIKIMTALHQGLARRGVDSETAHPWYFPTPEAYQELLETQGFQVTYIALIPRPTPLPGDMIGWLETFAESFIFSLPEPERRAYLEEVQEQVRPYLCDAEGRWQADYVRLRFAAVKPGL